MPSNIPPSPGSQVPVGGVTSGNNYVTVKPQLPAHVVSGPGGSFILVPDFIPPWWGSTDPIQGPIQAAPAALGLQPGSNYNDSSGQPVSQLPNPILTQFRFKK